MKSKEPEPTTENPQDAAKVEKTLDKINDDFDIRIIGETLDRVLAKRKNKNQQNGLPTPN